LELVYSAARAPVVAGGFDNVAVHVDDLEATRADLAAAELDLGPVETPGGPDGPRTASMVDPDGYRLELVPWPPGQPSGMIRGDFHSASRTQPATSRGDTWR
jgi:lactoylglutathione lyase